MLQAADGADAVGAIVGQCGEQVGEGFAEDGVAQLGGDLAERFQHKAALGERGVREGEDGCPQDEIVDEQEVEIEGARAFGEVVSAVAAVALFHVEEEAEQRFGIEAGLEQHGGVDEGRLVCQSDGFGEVERGLGEEASGGGQLGHGGEQRLPRLSDGGGEIGSESDGGQAHGGRLAGHRFSHEGTGSSLIFSDR